MDVLSISIKEEIKTHDKPHTGHKWGIHVNVIPKGRPYLFKHEILRQAEYFARFGLTEYQMANIWGVTPRSLNRWKHSHPELSQAIEKGKETANLSVTKRLQEACDSHNITAIIFWLTNRQPELWRDRRALVNQKIVQGQVVVHGEEKQEARKFLDTLDEGQKKQFIMSVNRLEKELTKVENEQTIDTN